MSAQWYVKLAAIVGLEEGYKCPRRSTPGMAWRTACNQWTDDSLIGARLVRVTKSTKKRDATLALHRAVETWAMAPRLASEQKVSEENAGRAYELLVAAAVEWRAAIRFGAMRFGK